MNPTPPARWLSGDGVDAGSALACVLVDAPIENDRRVRRVIAEQGGPVVVLDISQARSTPVHELVDRLHAGWLVAVGLRGWRKRHAALRPHFQDSVGHAPFAGLPACFRQTVMAVRGARALRGVMATYRPSRLHANDLTAGLSVALVDPQASASRVYDAHELEIHRHRKAGWLRILVEHAHEGRAIAAASEVRTVNEPIAEKLRVMYPGDSARCQVVHNDLFEHHTVEVAAANTAPALAYVGTGSRGRRLEQLADATQHGFSVHTWLLDRNAPATANGTDWHYGSDDYETELLALVRSRRTLMWCCVDTSSLSYRLALPNKFFQALAACMPIVASPGSYLAQLVDRYEIGAIDDGASLGSLARRISTDEYVRWVENVVALRSALRSGTLTL